MDHVRPAILSKHLVTIAAKEAFFCSLRDAWTSTATPHRRLVLTVLGELAEFECEVIRSRTTEGREPGVKAETDQPPDAQGTLAEIGRSYNVSGWTISRP